MDNIRLLSKILMSDNDYWLLAKKNEVNNFSRTERRDDYIMLVCLPLDRRKSLSYDEITLKDLEKLRSLHVDTNIFLNTNYPPFQLGQSLYDVYDGHPVIGDIKKFMVKALSLESSDLYEYKNLIEAESEVSND